MKTLSTTVLVTSLLFGMPVMAGSDHDHGHSHSQGPISRVDVINEAAAIVNNLSSLGKIDSTWLGTKATSALKKKFKQGTEWVIEFKNDKVSDASKQTLYIFYSLDGQYIAANYTGE